MSITVTVKLSKDAHNWGAATFHDLGETGDFCKAAIRRRCGSHRQLVAEFSVSDPYKADVMALALEAEPER